MDVLSTPKKGKKGLGRLWAKIKLAIKPTSKRKVTTIGLDRPPSPSKPTQRHRQDILPAMAGTDQERTQPMEIERLEQPSSQIPQPPPEPVIQNTSRSIPTTIDTNTVIAAITMQPSARVGPEPQARSDNQISEEGTTVPNPEVAMQSGDKEELVRRYERAQAMFKKYNLELDQADWEFHPKTQVERVHKPARIRIRWTCHECKTTFGHDKICVECAHQRCKSCARYPPKKRKVMAAKKAAIAAATTEPPKDDVQEGACHECQTPFDLGSQECSNCHHQICERCLQETLASVEQGETPVIVTT